MNPRRSEVRALEGISSLTDKLSQLRENSRLRRETTRHRKYRRPYALCAKSYGSAGSLGSSPQCMTHLLNKVPSSAIMASSPTDQTCSSICVDGAPAWTPLQPRKSHLTYCSRQPTKKALFLSRLHPDTSVSTVKKLVTSVYKDESVVCKRLKTKFPSYVSFHVAVSHAYFDLVNQSSVRPSGCLFLQSGEEERLPLELDFPELNPARKARYTSGGPSESRGRSPSSGGILRRQSRSPSVTRKARSPSRERVSWVDTTKGTRRTGENEPKKQQQKQSKENEAMETLPEENRELQPATKKRTIEKRGTQEISSIDAGMDRRLSGIEARMDDRLNKLEAKMERMFETIKADIAEKSRLDHERFVKIEGAVQQL
ncbi:hypothetical protein HPB48_002181 [Haemaphysalis longicornis]|uniref:Uncharacterized protein n=1 Tax=Haemaphysalis longicornis TaxID=44386 RepID=A0A9J6FGZ7_HAELO|nr:hypothetical protein HPB48_002181 [Haemaphysalis longicornis]